MQRRLMGAMTAILVLSLAGAAFAAAPPASTAPATAKPATAAATHAGHAIGTLASVDAKASTLVLQVKTEKIQFTVTPTTRYLSAGKSAQLGALTPGAHLRVEYKKSGTTRTASSVEVLPTPAKKP